MFQQARYFWKSAVVITKAVTGGEGPFGGHATKNSRNLLQSSMLYMEDDRFGSSIKLEQIIAESIINMTITKHSQQYIIWKNIKPTKIIQSQVVINRSSITN